MITNQLLSKVLSLSAFNDCEFSGLGLSTTITANSLSFLEDEKYINQINENLNITGSFVTAELASFLDSRIISIIVDDPRFYFFTLQNYLAKANKVIIPTIIDPSAIVYPQAYISENNVFIGKNTIVYPNATILDDVTIGQNCIIQSGTVIGSEGFEYKRTSKGIISVIHDGVVEIHDNVHIGSNTSIDKGFSFRKTTIESDVKIDNLIHIAHGVQICKGAFIIAGTILGGSSTIGAEAWTSINASIAPGITIKKKGFVSMGAVVTKTVEENQQVTGNLAIPHDKFMENFKKTLR